MILLKCWWKWGSDSVWSLSDLMQPLSVPIYMRKRAILERKLSEPVTGAVVLWEMVESSHYPWSGLWWLHKCLQACCYLAECRIYSSPFKRSRPLISGVLTGLFLLLHKENISKYLFYFFFFCAERSSSLVLYFPLKHNRLLRQHFPSTEHFCCHSLWRFPQMVLLERCTWWCGFCIGGLQFAHIQKLSCLPGSLQFAAPANCPQINGKIFPPNGTAWIKVLSWAGVDECHSPNLWSALSDTLFVFSCFFPAYFAWS